MVEFINLHYLCTLVDFFLIVLLYVNVMKASEKEKESIVRKRVQITWYIFFNFYSI